MNLRKLFLFFFKSRRNVSGSVAEVCGVGERIMKGPRLGSGWKKTKEAQTVGSKLALSGE